MSLIRFLSSGNRGLTKGAPAMGRYRLPDGRLIPDFGGGKNPFTPKTSRALPAREESSSVAGVPARAALTQAAPPSPVTFEKAAQPVKLPSRLACAAGGLVARGQRTVIQLLSLAKRLPVAVIAKFPRRKRQEALATSSNPQFRGPVQTELSLEKVRVVRNDLTDTDYELVCSETATASPVRQVPKTVPVPTNPRPLGRLAERLFSHKAH